MKDGWLVFLFFVVGIAGALFGSWIAGEKNAWLGIFLGGLLSQFLFIEVAEVLNKRSKKNNQF